MHVDLLQGPIFRSMVIYMLPILVSLLFQHLYSLVDTMIVGNCLGEDSLGAVGCTGPIYDLFVLCSLGMGTGLSFVTARSFGSGDAKTLRKSVAMSMEIGLGTSLILTVIAMVILKPLLILLHTPEELLEEAYAYCSVILLFLVVIFGYNLCTALLRAVGNSFFPLLFLILSSLLNVVLDFVFILPLQMGVAGAAWATVLAQLVSVVLCILYMVKTEKQLIPRLEDFKPEKQMFLEIMGQGYSMGLMSSIVSVGSIVLQSGINVLGASIITAHTAVRRLFLVFNMPNDAIQQAQATFASQNKGANQRERIIKGIKICYGYSFCVVVVISVILIPFGEKIVHLVTGSSNPEILYWGGLYLKVLGPSYFVLSVMELTRYTLQGIGEKVIPLISSVIEFVGKVLFVMFLIPRYGYMAVVFCEPVIWLLMAIQLLISFARNPYIRGRS